MAQSPISRTSRPSAVTADALPGDAYLVKDIRVPGDSDPSDITAVGNIAFFAANGPGGRELWKTDGTEPGTLRVKNIRPGEKSSNPSELTAIGGLVYFAATADSGDRELWVSNGTAAGTNRVKNINSAGSSDPYYLANVSGTLFFSANGPGGRELWKSNGTAVGTVRVKDIKAGSGSSDPSDIIAVGSLAFFSAAANSVDDFYLWRTDGTAAGTYRLTGQDPFVVPAHFVRVGDRAYFTAINDTGGCSLSTSYFRTDGTNEGTFAVADEGIENVPAASFNNRFFYGEGAELRRANASETGSVLVKRFNSQVVFEENPIVDMARVGSRLYVMVDVSDFNGGAVVRSDRQLWRSDGTKAGTKMVYSWGMPIYGDPEMTNVGGELFFISAETDGQTDVWRSNGTTAGTTRVEQIGNSNPDSLSAVDGSLYWSEDDGTTGRELWRYVP